MVQGTLQIRRVDCVFASIAAEGGCTEYCKGAYGEHFSVIVAKEALPFALTGPCDMVGVT